MKIIVAYGEGNRVIGNDGELPWRIPADVRLFQAATIGDTVIMGRKTFDSLNNHPLAHRDNVVITSSTSPAWWFTGVEIIGSPEAAFAKYPDAWIIGGGSIYKAALESGKVELVLATVVKGSHEGDVYFPELPGWEGFLYLRRPECEFWAFRPMGGTTWQPAGVKSGP
jgi:dihydrofolate reductase